MVDEVVEPEFSADVPSGMLYDEIEAVWGPTGTKLLFASTGLVEVEINGGATLRGHVTHADTEALWLHREVDPQVREAIGSDVMDSNVSVQRVDVVDIRKADDEGRGK